MLLKLKCRKFKKINNWENYFIDLKSKSKSKFRYPNNRISNPSLYKKAQTRNLKINGFCKFRSPFIEFYNEFVEVGT